MNFLMTLIYFLIAIGILVLVHEFGHFITARLSGMRTEVFAFGMGNRLFGWNKKSGFSFGKLPDDFDGEGHTDYRVAAFPVGGYVKISGMVDESMDANFKDTPPQPYEFRTKNVFQKVITISGGVLMNVILAFLIYSIIFQIQGKDEYATTKIGAVADSSIASDIGLKPGDEIVSVNGNKITTWNELATKLPIEDIGSDKIILVKRENETLQLKIDGKKLMQDISEKKYIGISSYFVRTFLTAVINNKPAGMIKLLPGDTMLAINSKPVFTSHDFQKEIHGNKSKTILLTWKRDNRISSDSITPTADGLIGVGLDQAYTGPKIHENFNIFTAMMEGANETYNSIKLISGGFIQMISGNISFKQNVGGPIAIAKMASQQAERGLESFMNFLALMSIMLAVVNILPFPALDGGHLVVILLEALIKRELPIKVKIAIQQVGMVILLGFMAFVIYLDITR
jgi:regulator of sigma E protease